MLDSSTDLALSPPAAASLPTTSVPSPSAAAAPAAARFTRPSLSIYPPHAGDASTDGLSSDVSPYMLAAPQAHSSPLFSPSLFSPSGFTTASFTISPRAYATSACTPQGASASTSAAATPRQLATASRRASEGRTNRILQEVRGGRRMRGVTSALRCARRLSASGWSSGLCLSPVPKQSPVLGPQPCYYYYHAPLRLHLLPCSQEGKPCGYKAALSSE